MRLFASSSSKHRDAASRGAEAAISQASEVDVEQENPYPSLPSVIILLLGFAAAWVSIQGMQQLKDIIAPVFFGLNLVIVAYPLKRWLSNKGVPEVLGAAASVLAVFLVLLGMIFSLIWALTMFIEEMPAYSGKFTQLYDQLIRYSSRWGIDKKLINDKVHTLDPTSFIGAAQSLLSSLTGIAGLLLVIATLLFFLGFDTVGFSGRMEIAKDHNPVFVGSLANFARGVRRYWVVSTVFGLVVAVLDWGVLALLGVPMAMVWAVLSFVTNYIPNVGFVLGLLPPALMALLAGGPGAAVGVIIAYSVLNFGIQTLIQPKVAGEAVGVTATVSFISLLFWAWVMGALGAILALPATLLCKAILIDADPEFRWVNAFIANKPKSAGIPFRLRRQKENLEAVVAASDEAPADVTPAETD